MLMFIYAWGKRRDPLKIGYCKDIEQRLTPTDHYERPIYKAIYQVTESEIDKFQIDKGMKEFLKEYSVESPDYTENERKPKEFYNPKALGALDNYLKKLKHDGLIDYVKFKDLDDYKKNRKIEISDDAKYNLNNVDPDYQYESDNSSDEYENNSPKKISLKGISTSNIIERKLRDRNVDRTPDRYEP